MSTYEYEERKTGHPVVGLILGLLGIAAALLLVMLTGVIGAAIAGALGLIALILGIGARKTGKGLGAIITGVLAILLAVGLFAGTTKMMTMLKDEAVKTGKAPMVEKFMDKPYLGFLGMIMNMPTNEADVDELVRQIKSLTEEV